MRILLTFIFLLVASPLSANPFLMYGGTSGATNYLNHANCQAAYYMNSAVAETDRCNGGSENLSVSGGDTIPTSGTVPAGFAGTSRDWESGDDEYLYHADGGSTDISGANQELTICIWVDLESDTSFRDIAGKWITTTDQRQYKIQYDSNLNAVKFMLSSDGADDTIAIGATNISTNPAFICGVYNDTDIRIYIDGVLDSNGASNPKTYSAGIFNGTAQFIIGEEPDVGAGFDGLGDEVIVLDTALTATQVLEISANGIDGSKGGND